MSREEVSMHRRFIPLCDSPRSGKLGRLLAKVSAPAAIRQIFVSPQTYVLAPHSVVYGQMRGTAFASSAAFGEMRGPFGEQRGSMVVLDVPPADPWPHFAGA
jgi:hypothetical protein